MNSLASRPAVGWNGLPFLLESQGLMQILIVAVPAGNTTDLGRCFAKAGRLISRLLMKRLNDQADWC